jgi:DNA-directed RNA polymerase omega subunit
MTTDRPVDVPEPRVPPLRSDVQSIFHLVIVASLRAKQLMAGARPRVEPDGHRPARIALLEVTAGLVSWSLSDPPRVIAPATAGKDAPPVR